MNKGLLALGFIVTISAPLMGCGGSSTKKDAGTDAGGGTDGPASTACTASIMVTGIGIDVDKLGGHLATDGSNWVDMGTTGIMDALAAGAVPNSPIHVEYEDGTANTASVTTDANGDFAIMVCPNKTIHFVAETNAANNVVQTYEQEPVMVGTAAVSGTAAHFCTSNNYSSPSGVAAAAGLSVDQLVTQGVAEFAGLNKVSPPFAGTEPSTIVVTPSGFDVYGWTNQTSTPPGYTKGTTAPFGIYGITQAGLTSKVTITGQLTDTSSNAYTYAPSACDVKPGYVTFCNAPTPTN